MVGRERERADAGRLLDAIAEGRGQVLFVAGAAGVGKTTFLAELEERAKARNLRTGSGVAARVAADWPYAPVLEALSDLCRQHPSLLDGLDDSLRAEIERALSGRTSGWDRQGTQQRLYVATSELLRLASAGAGAVLVVDDAHAADEASLRLLHYLVRSSRSERVLIVLGHRPADRGPLAEVRASLSARPGASSLDLTPLSRDEAVAVARTYAPEATEAVLEAMYEASGGVPFAVVELARGWTADPASSGGLAWLPSGLSSQALEALAMAAVLGSAFDTDEFAATTRLPDEAAYAVLDEGVMQRVLDRRAAGYAFRHALIREALLEAAGPGRTREAHLRAARTIEGLDGSPVRIAHHLVEAGHTDEAVPWMLLASETQAALGAYRDALAGLDSVASHATTEQRAQLLALRAALLSACGDRRAIQAYRDALAASSDPDDEIRLKTALARAAVFAGDLDTAELASAGLTLDGGANDADLLLVRGNLAFFRHDFKAADEAAAEARRRIGLGAPDDWRLFDLVALQGLLAHHRGEWFEKLRLELRAGVDHPAMAVGIFDSHLCVAEYLLYGPTPYDEVLTLAAELRRTAERAGVLRAVAFATALRGEAALLKGDLELAESELLDSADLHHDLASPSGEAHSLQRLAEVHLAQGDRATAAGLLQRALPLARWSTVGLHLLQRIYGSMVAAASDPEAALAVVDRAEATLGPDDHCTFCSIMWAVPAAQACADAGDLDRAQSYLALAETSESMWEGTSWQAHLLEVRAHLAAARDETQEASRLMEAAMSVFAAAGQPLDAQRCAAGLQRAKAPVA